MRALTFVRSIIFVFIGLIPFLGHSTILYLRDSASPLGTLSTDGAGMGCFRNFHDYKYRLASQWRGSASVTKSFAPTNQDPPCLAQTGNSGGEYLMWVSPPLASAVTIDSNISYSLGCRESHSAVNAGFRFVVKKWSARIGGIESVIHTSASSSECPTSSALRTITAEAPTVTSLAAGDRIVIIVEIVNVGSWGGNSSRTVSVVYDGSSGSSGDSFVNFVDTLSFVTDGPSQIPSVQ